MTNTDITYITTPHANFIEKVNLYFASGDLPDVIGSIDAARLADYVDDGGVLNLTPYFESDTGKKLIEESILEDKDFPQFTFGGKIYGIPQPRTF